MLYPGLRHRCAGRDLVVAVEDLHRPGSGEPGIRVEQPGEHALADSGPDGELERTELSDPLGPAGSHRPSPRGACEVPEVCVPCELQR